MKYVCKRKLPKVGAFFNSIGAFSEKGRKKKLLPLIKLIDYLVVPEEFALGFTEINRIGGRK